MRIISLVLLLTSLMFAKIYRNTTTEVVIDETNKLVWVDDETNLLNRLTHEQATQYCQNLNHANYTDWRLPTLEEFETIVDKKNKINYIKSAFRYNHNTGYWADRALWRTLWFYADYMHFVSGTAYYDSRHKKKFVRCVRSY